MYILILLSLILIMIYMIYINHIRIEKFIDNDDYWKDYRLGDIFKYWIFIDQNKVLKDYPNSIGALYLKRNPEKKKNYKLLFKIIDEKSKNMELPKENDLVLHLRIGDAIKDFVNGKFVYNYDWFNISYATKIEVLEQNIDKIKGKNVVIFYGNHMPSNRPKINKNINELYLQHIRDLFKKNNISFIEKNSGNPDKDFIYMCNSKTFVQSGGGYSKLIGKYVSHKGNRVIELNKI